MLVEVYNRADAFANDKIRKIYEFIHVYTFDKHNVCPSREIEGTQTCIFDLDDFHPSLEKKKGVYILVCDDKVVYVGQSGDIHRRWCYKYHNPTRTTKTNIRINNKIYDSVINQKKEVYLLVSYTDTNKDDEKILIGTFLPEWNR